MGLIQFVDFVLDHPLIGSSTLLGHGQVKIQEISAIGKHDMKGNLLNHLILWNLCLGRNSDINLLNRSKGENIRAIESVEYLEPNIEQPLTESWVEYNDCKYKGVHKSVACPFFSEFKSINVEIFFTYWSIPPMLNYPLEPL
jgi:hypothetical protein